MKLESLDFTALQELAETLRLALYEYHPRYTGAAKLFIRTRTAEPYDVFETDLHDLDHVRAFLLGWIAANAFAYKQGPT